MKSSLDIRNSGAHDDAGQLANSCIADYDLLETFVDDLIGEVETKRLSDQKEIEDAEARADKQRADIAKIRTASPDENPLPDPDS